MIFTNSALKLSREESIGCSDELWNALQGAAKADVTKSMVVLEFGYDAKVVLPYDEAMIFLQSLSKAEKFDTSDYSKPCITPAKFKMEMQLISRDEYHDLKMRHLLQMNLQEKDDDGD